MDNLIVIDTKPEQEALVIRFMSQKVDAANANLIRKKLAELTYGEFDAQGIRRVVLSLAYVRAIDSTLLGLMMSFWKATARNSSAEVSLVTNNDAIRHLLTISKIDMLFNIYESEALALAGSHSGRPA